MVAGAGLERCYGEGGEVKEVAHGHGPAVDAADEIVFRHPVQNGEAKIQGAGRLEDKSQERLRKAADGPQNLGGGRR